MSTLTYNGNEAFESAIAADLERCDVMLAIGSKSMKKAARTHREKCFEAIRAANRADGLDNGQTDEGLLTELGVCFEK